MKNFIPAGYRAFRKTKKPEWLKDDLVEEIWSVSDCMNGIDCDWINDWSHNRHWHFNSIDDLIAVYQKCEVPGPYEIVYLELYDFAFDKNLNQLVSLWSEESFQTNVKIPASKVFIGYDIVSFYGKSSPECSPLSCNHMSREFSANKFCLSSLSIDEIIKIMKSINGDIGEPGPYKIYSVYKVF